MQLLLFVTLYLSYVFSDISDDDIMKVNIPNSVPCVFEYDMSTGRRVGNIQYLADAEYVKTETEKVASIGN